MAATLDALVTLAYRRRQDSALSLTRKQGDLDRMKALGLQHTVRGAWATARNSRREYTPSRDGNSGHAVGAPKGSLLIGAGVGQARSACSISLSMKHVVWHTQSPWLVCRAALTRLHGVAVDVQSTGAMTDKAVQYCIVTSPAKY